jgi:glycosyltransferase involved in cell wall biosynthesis
LSDTAHKQIEATRGFSLAYVSTQYPSLSLAWEQYEVLGLQDAGARVSLLSCRTPRRKDRYWSHGTTGQLAAIANYFSLSGFLRGLIWCLGHRPATVANLFWLTLREALAQPNRAHKLLGSWALAVTFAPLGHRQDWKWVHANFAQGSTTVAWYLSRLLKVPFSLWAHAFDIFTNLPQSIDRASFFSEKIHSASLVLGGSGYALHQLEEKVGPPPLTLDGVQLAGLKVSETKVLPYSFGPGMPRVVALGRLVPKKGFHVLIEAISRLRDAGLQVACDIHGGGEERDLLQALVRFKDVDELVTVHGPYKQEELPGLVRSARALVVPSVLHPSGDMDGIPGVIYEVMAMGRPVIASAISGIPEVVDQGVNGYLVQPDDPSKLALAIARIVQNPARAAAMGQNARAWAEAHHDTDNLGRQLLELIRDALGQEDCSTR